MKKLKKIMDWIRRILKEYLKRREENAESGWISCNNFSKRFTLNKKTRTESFNKLSDADFAFWQETRDWIRGEIRDAKLTPEQLKDMIESLQLHISRTEERWTFLVGYAAIITIFIVLIKSGIIPFEVVSLVFVTFLAFILLQERTIHLNRKHACLELIKIVEHEVSHLETSIRKIDT